MSTESIQTPVADTVTLGRVNQPPAQTWNRLHVNDITLTVPKISRKGDVYFALPQLFSKVETGMGEKVTAWVTSQAADARYVEVPAHTVREEPVVIAVDADKGEVVDTGVMVREGATATIVVAVAGTSDPPASRSVKVFPFTVAGSSARSKVALTAVSRLTPVAPAPGSRLTSVGPAGVVRPVVKVQSEAASSGDPSAPWTPSVTWAVYVVATPSGAVGVRTAVLVAAS